MQRLPGDHKADDYGEAMRLASITNPLYLGVFYQEEAPSFEEGLEGQKSGSEADTQQLLEKLFDRFS